MARNSDAGKLFADLSSGRCGRVVVDFDHTLFLDNSTERYLDALRPRVLAFLIAECCDFLLLVLAKLGLCRYDRQRDYVRGVLCTLLMPWSALLWRRTAPILARDRMNHDLIAALPEDQPVIVLSYGFRHIIRPLLDAAGLAGAVLVSSTVWPAQNLRRSGKVSALAKHLPAPDWQDALFVTDSQDDAPVIAAIARSHVVAWEPPSEPAFHHLYVPLRYTTRVKYAGSRYFIYQIVLEDYVLLLLAYAFAWHYAALLGFLLLSLYTIYEVGHYENDHRATVYETHPKVAEGAREFPPLPRFQPWLWAVALALAGVVCFRLPGALAPRLFVVHVAGDLFLWMLVLVGVYGAFRVFNRLKPRQRVAVFPVLHIFKTFSYVLFVPLTGVGALLLTAQVASISANYALYRFTGDFSHFNRQLWRMFLFLLLTLACYSVKPAVIVGVGLVRWVLILLWGFIRSLEHARRMNIVRLLATLGKETADADGEQT